MLNYGDHNSFSDLFSVCLRAFDHINFQLRIFSGHTASFKTGVSKVQNFVNFEFSPMQVLSAEHCCDGPQNVGA